MAAAPQVSTGLPFFDHMRDQLGQHGGFALDIVTEGDLQVDEHHTVEDTALALGQALREALGDKRGLQRYGFTLPMDEALASAALNLGGRPYLVLHRSLRPAGAGDRPPDTVQTFVRPLWAQ